MMMWTLRFFSSSFHNFLLVWQNPVYFILRRSRSEMNNNEMKSERIIQNDEYSMNRDMFYSPPVLHSYLPNIFALKHAYNRKLVK